MVPLCSLTISVNSFSIGFIKFYCFLHCVRDRKCGFTTIEFKKNGEFSLSGSEMSFLDLNIKAHWAEAVIATYHCAHRVLHPSVIEIAFPSGKGFHKFPH